MDTLDRAAALLDRLETAGLIAGVVDGSLRIGPPNRLTDDLRGAITAHRETIIHLPATAQPAPVFDVDLLTCDDATLAGAIASHPDLTMELVLEADHLGHALRHDGPDAIAAFRWFTRHPAPGYDRSDHLAALLAIRTATGRGPPVALCPVRTIRIIRATRQEMTAMTDDHDRIHRVSPASIWRDSTAPMARQARCLGGECLRSRTPVQGGTPGNPRARRPGSIRQTDRARAGATVANAGGGR